MAKVGSGKKKVAAVRKKQWNATKSSLHKTGKSIFGPAKKSVEEAHEMNEYD